jgi:hypothetical protein
LEARAEIGSQDDAVAQNGAVGAAPLLMLDPKLGSGLSHEQRSHATRELIARTTLLRPGDSGEELFHTGLFGALVVEGALARRVWTGRGRSLEVLVKGDLLRPWQEDSGWVVESEIHPIVDTRVAVIDRFAGDSLCRFPPVIEALVERVLSSARSARRSALRSAA